MPIKEKSVFKKHEYEYESPDGDKYSITYVECSGKEYVEIGRSKEDGTVEDKVVWDVAMFKDISDTIMKIKYGNSLSLPSRPSRGLSVPNIIDHRADGDVESIERSVSRSMSRIDESIPPVESFDYDNVSWQKNATGIDIEEIGDEESPQVEKNTQYPRNTTHDPRKEIKRINAEDLM